MAIVKVQQICNEMYAWTLMFWSVKENEIKLKKTTCRDYVPVNGFYMPNIFTVLLYTVKKAHLLKNVKFQGNIYTVYRQIGQASSKCTQHLHRFILVCQ